MGLFYKGKVDYSRLTQMSPITPFSRVADAPMWKSPDIKAAIENVIAIV